MIDWRPRIEALAKEQQADEQAIIAAGDDSSKIAQLSRSMGERSEMLALGSKFLELTQELEKVKELEQNEKDPEMLELVRNDAQRLSLEIEKCDAELYELIMPKDPDDSRNVVLEVRAGTGGEEAALFAADLFALYLKYADLKKWRAEVVDFNATELEGCRDATLAISGKNVYGTLKYESGVHRVQRVPKTESQGRVHTSAASVMVLPEAEQVDIQIDDKDLRIDRYRAQGAGGQHVNRTDSAVRITHLPTGIVAQCQDNKSQHRNRDQAMRVMRARVYELARSKEADERLEKRRSLIKSGDRSQRIRTFNFSQNRITDHRINFTTRKLDRVLETGDLDEILEALKSADRQGAESLQATGD